MIDLYKVHCVDLSERLTNSSNLKQFKLNNNLSFYF